MDIRKKRDRTRLKINCNVLPQRPKPQQLRLSPRTPYRYGRRHSPPQHTDLRGDNRHYIPAIASSKSYRTNTLPPSSSCSEVPQSSMTIDADTSTSPLTAFKNLIAIYKGRTNVLTVRNQRQRQLRYTKPGPIEKQ